VTDEEQMGKLTKDFFINLYTKDDSVLTDLITEHPQLRVNAVMNTNLYRDFSNEEISDALFQIGPLKALRPDGFPARFFQRNWDTLKDNVIKGVKQFFSSSHMPDGVNDTVIVLITKNKDAKELKDYRPISLCNVIYKVVSKCLVNRLRPILKEIITPTQSAFIPRHMITDNAIIAFECLHVIQHCNDKRGEFCAINWTWLKPVTELTGTTSRRQ
jgi:hypothetical protein